MTADIRMGLENELDHLDESLVESWVHRCFESCDPRYDTDWLMGMFELALMQFPDNYEVRAAASKASTMEAQRLFDEGDTGEAVSRLERLLESDPYCTEAFEMLERFMQASPGPSQPEPAVAQAPVPEAPLTVPETPPVEIAPLPHDDELLSFLDEDLMIDVLPTGISAPADPVSAPEVPPAPVSLASPPAELPPPPALEIPRTELAPPPLEVPPPLAIAPPPLEVPPPVAIAAPPVEAPAPVAITAPPVEAPAPVALAAPPPLPAPPAAPGPVPVVAGSSFDWRSVVGLPAHTQPTLEPQLEAILPSLTERFSQVGNYRSLVMLLTDLYQRDPSHQGVSNNLNSVLHDWASQLEKQGRGPEAGQVAAWSRQLLGERANWAPDLLQRFPSHAPNLPDLGSLTGVSSPTWMNWINPLREDPSRYEAAGQSLAHDAQGLQSLFRHLAVQHPDQPDHVLNLGWAYSKTGQHALAMVHTQRSLQMRQSARAYQLLQKVYTDLGQPEMAQRVAQQISQLS